MRDKTKYQPQPTPEERFASLIAKGQSNAAAAFLHITFGASLTRRLHGLALPLGGGDEAEYLANWAIALAVAKGAGFDAKRGSLGTWLTWIGRNLALSHQRKLRPDALRERAVEVRTRTAESCIQNKEAFQRIWNRIGSDVLRQVLFVDLQHAGQAPGFVARELGLDRATFYKHRCEARRLFRELWLNEFGDPADSFFRGLE